MKSADDAAVVLDGVRNMGRRRIPLNSQGAHLVFDVRDGQVRLAFYDNAGKRTSGLAPTMDEALAQAMADDPTFDPAATGLWLRSQAVAQGVPWQAQG